MLTVLFILMIAVIALISLGIWIATIVDVVNSDFKKVENKYVWLCLVILFPFFGTLFYYLIGPKHKVEYDYMLV